MLRILPKYFMRELLKTFAYAFAAVLLIIFLAFALQMMITKGLNIFKMPRAVVFLLLMSFPYALPTSLLASVIMTYGRFSGDNEILAIRSSGIHLQWITTPTVLLGTVCSLFTLFVNGNLLPATEAKLKTLEKDQAIRFFVDQMGGMQQASMDLPGWEVFVRSQDGEVVKDVLVFKTENDQVIEVIKGKKGWLRTSDPRGAIQLELEDVERANFSGNDRNLQWGHCEKFVVPLPKSRQKDNFHNRPRFLGIFALFWKQKDLAQQVASQETKLPDPAKVLIKLRREREDLLTEIGVKNEELKDAAKDIEKFSTAAGLANKKADESVQRGKELAAKLQQLEARRKAAEEKLLATQAERDKKAQELKRLEEPAQIEPASPEKLVLVDRLKREIKGLEAEVEALKEEAMAHTTEVAELQRDIKTIAANTEAQRQLAVTCAKQGAEQREKSETITKEKNEMLATIEGIDRLREAATQQKLFHDVRCVINERLALAFSPLAFVLIAIPLGILCRHGHILVGFSIGMGLILIYYGLFTTGRVMAEGRYFYIVPSYWAADGLLSVVGVALLANIFKR